MPTLTASFIRNCVRKPARYHGSRAFASLWLRPLFRVRVKPVLQTNATDCGPACLTMILNFYGCRHTLNEVTDVCGTGRNGVSALTLVDVAERLGFAVTAASLRHEEFGTVKLPAIVHWNSTHFVVVEQWSSGWVQIVDPAIGRRRVSAVEFQTSLTNVVLTFEPRGAFSPAKTSTRLSGFGYLKSVFAVPGLLVQIVAASFVLQVMGLGAPLFTAAIVDRVVPSHQVHLLNQLGLGLLVLFVSHALVTYMRSRLLIKLQAKTDDILMVGLFRHLQSLPFRFFQTRSTGDLLERFASNIVIRETLSQDFLSFILDSLLVTSYLVVILLKAPIYALTVLLLACAQALLLLGTYQRTRSFESSCLITRSQSSAYLLESIAGIATLKSAGAGLRALQHWSGLFRKQLEATARRDRFEAMVGAGLTLVRSLGPLVLLWLGAIQVTHGYMSLGTMFALNGLALGVLVPISSVFPNWQKFHVMFVHLNRVLSVLSIEKEQEPEDVQRPPKLTGKIDLEDVTFRYDTGGPPVLNHVSLSIAAGQKVAIVGRTGSGKSTLAKIMLGLYPPTEGRIFYDGLPLRTLDLSELRQQLGIVLQDTYIFEGSIRDNIAFNNPCMPLQAVQQAARLAALNDDLRSMPMGYDTYVAEGGRALSGGQRQRLAIARALAQGPAIVLLDEATSHLDTLTEAAVGRNLSELCCTRLVIAHRLSTVRDSDLILVMEGGEIVEQGTHEHLLSLGGLYRQLVAAQHDEAERGNKRQAE